MCNTDLATALASVATEDGRRGRTPEGTDDMLLSEDVFTVFPCTSVRDGVVALGNWQGIYVASTAHRRQPDGG